MDLLACFVLYLKYKHKVHSGINSHYIQTTWLYTPIQAQALVEH